MGCYIWYSEEGPGWAVAPPSPILALPDVTAHPSAAYVPITVLLYGGPLLCGFNVAIEGLHGLDGDWNSHLLQLESGSSAFYAMYCCEISAFCPVL